MKHLPIEFHSAKERLKQLCWFEQLSKNNYVGWRRWVKRQEQPEKLKSLKNAKKLEMQFHSAKECRKQLCWLEQVSKKGAGGSTAESKSCCGPSPALPNVKINNLNVKVKNVFF